MKQLLTKLYFALMGPLYRRLSRDVALRIQELERIQLEYQERFSARLTDQLVALSVAKNHSEALPLSDAAIIEIVAEINKSEDLVRLSKRLELPLKEVVEIYSRYGGMNATSIRTLLQMEERNRALASSLLSLSEDASAISSGTVDASPTAKHKLPADRRL